MLGLQWEWNTIESGSWEAEGSRGNNSCIEQFSAEKKQNKQTNKKRHKLSTSRKQNFPPPPSSLTPSISTPRALRADLVSQSVEWRTESSYLGLFSGGAVGCSAVHCRSDASDHFTQETFPVGRPGQTQSPFPPPSSCPCRCCCCCWGAGLSLETGLESHCLQLQDPLKLVLDSWELSSPRLTERLKEK